MSEPKREPDMDELKSLEQVDANEQAGSVYRLFVSSDDEDDGWLEVEDDDEDDDPDAYICPICEQYADYCECDGDPEELWPTDENGREL